ncbi:hypothetical protein D3C87_1868910 [compost metagenome]
MVLDVIAQPLQPLQVFLEFPCDGVFVFVVDEVDSFPEADRLGRSRVDLWRKRVGVD